MKAWKKVALFAISALLLVGMSPRVFAQQSNSTNYKIDDAYFGMGAELEQTSTNYKSSSSIGDTAVGPSSSTNFRSVLGANDTTQTEPMLELIVSGGGADLGVLTSTATAFGASDVKVRSYNSSGYTMQVTGTAPTQSVYTIPALTTPTTSQTNVEQFGINFRANTTPAVGADPVQVPDSSFSYGTPTADYNTANLFKYVSGDIVAQSVTATGETDYKMSYILNIKRLTPAGRYTTNISVVVSARF